MSALSNDATVFEKNNLEAIFEICTYGMMLAAGLGSMLYLDSYLTICVILASMVPLLVSVFFSGALQRAECCTSKHHADFIALLKDLDVYKRQTAAQLKDKSEIEHTVVSVNNKQHSAGKGIQELAAILSTAASDSIRSPRRKEPMMRLHIRRPGM